MNRAGFSLLAVLTALVILVAEARAQIGVVLVHGKQGTPDQMQRLAAGLEQSGFPAERPEMCWSRDRIYDRSYTDCLADIDTAVERLRAHGVHDVVVVGMSLGGNAVLGYGARRDNLKGIVALAPAHAPEFISQRPEIAESLAQARVLIAEGRGDAKVSFADVNTMESSFEFTVTTTANIYVSFFAADSPAVMPANAAQLKAPLLLISGTQDPTQRGAHEIFASAPPTALNRFVSVEATHSGTPKAGRAALFGWLRELAGDERKRSRD